MVAAGTHTSAQQWHDAASFLMIPPVDKSLPSIVNDTNMVMITTREASSLLTLTDRHGSLLDLSLMTIYAILRQNYALALQLLTHPSASTMMILPANSDPNNAMRFPPSLDWRVDHMQSWLHDHHDVVMNAASMQRIAVDGDSAEVWPSSPWLYRGVFLHAITMMRDDTLITSLFIKRESESGDTAVASGMMAKCDVEMINNDGRSLLYDLCAARNFNPVLQSVTNDVLGLLICGKYNRLVHDG